MGFLETVGLTRFELDRFVRAWVEGVKGAGHAQPERTRPEQGVFPLRYRVLDGCVEEAAGVFEVAPRLKYRSTVGSRQR